MKKNWFRIRPNKIYKNDLILLPVVDKDAIDADWDAFVVTAKVCRWRSVTKGLLQEDGRQLQRRGGQVQQKVSQKLVPRPGLEQIETFEKWAQSFDEVAHEVVAVDVLHELWKEKCDLKWDLLGHLPIFFPDGPITTC